MKFLNHLPLGFCLILALLISPAFSKDPVSSAKIEVEARLMEIEGTMPANELYNYVYVFKYRIQKVIQGKLQSKTILVGHYNPLIPRSQISDKMKDQISGDLSELKVGQKHLLKLVPLEDAWVGAIEDEYFDDEESPRYFAIYADLIP